MSSETWDVVRDGDGDVLGRVTQFDDARRPDTVFGPRSANAVSSPAEAEDVARSEGLTALAEPWWGPDR